MNQDAVLMKEWLPAAYATDVKDAPFGVILMGERIVLFRTSEGIHAWKDLCIHRGAALSLGKVVDDTLVCPYHGWRYDGTGGCVLIPQQNPNQAITKQARAITYEACEANGIIWVRLESGSATRPPVFTEFEDESFHMAFCDTYELKAAAPRVIENFLDVGHLAFLHEGYLGDSAYPEISDYTVNTSEEGIRSSEIDVFQPDPDGRGRPVTARYIYEVLKPTVARLKKTDPDTSSTFSILFAVMPVQPTVSKVFVVLGRNYAFDVPDKQFTDFQTLILSQDEIVLESQRPELLPLDLQAELHLKCDRLSIAYRKWLVELGMTWGTA
ncbi:aromatic ring-hydroxylating oxygenase subunit alpha [Paenibacillus beijingensis]|uniref:(2Fe-2S)-binding protein n=1 Tax=Paenibacillus beijingensis TaxID=1126833 RepID=A0A0D5NFP5_9BACL|nr:aromatic ring-hydroxylating dioxygenase subunit alpha [Paenibacillus beijingensis]AJY74091.1 (2Fe-2S)-binding protein [Paenibacillus beijingensis]